MGTLIGLFIKLFKYFLIFIMYYFAFCGAVLLPLLLILVIKPDLLNLVFPNAKAATPEELQKVILIALVPTVVKTYRDTSSEYYTPWIFWVLSYICSLLVVMILEMDISLQQYLIAALLFLNAFVILIKKFKIRS